MNCPESKKGNREFVRLFSPVLMARSHDLLSQDFQAYRIALVNFAPMLPHAARLKEEAIGNYLAEILTDHGDKGPNMHDAIKLYAARGLREFFPVTTLDATPLAAADVKRRDRDVRYVDVLVKFIERKAGDNLSEEEKNGQRFLRREAIGSLAACQSPAVLVENNKVEGAIAPTLLRILSPKGGLTPEPDLAERVEAALAVCQINYAKCPTYQPETGVFLVGTLIKDFATASNKDLAKNPKVFEQSWRIKAKQLELALKDLTKNARNQPIEAQAKKLEQSATPLLKAIQTPSQVNQGELQLFGKMLATIPRAPADAVYKGNKNYVIERENSQVTLRRRSRSALREGRRVDHPYVRPSRGVLRLAARIRAALASRRGKMAGCATAPTLRRWSRTRRGRFLRPEAGMGRCARTDKPGQPRWSRRPRSGTGTDLPQRRRSPILHALRGALPRQTSRRTPKRRRRPRPSGSGTRPCRPCADG